MADEAAILEGWRAWTDAAELAILASIDSCHDTKKKFWRSVNGMGLVALCYAVSGAHPTKDVADAATNVLAEDARFIPGLSPESYTLSRFSREQAKASKGEVVVKLPSSGGGAPQRLAQGELAGGGGGRASAAAAPRQPRQLPQRADMVAELIAAGADTVAAADTPTYGDFVDSGEPEGAGRGGGNSEGGGCSDSEEGDALAAWEAAAAGAGKQQEWTRFFLGGAGSAAAEQLHHGSRCAVAVGPDSSSAFRESALLGSVAAGAFGVAQPQPLYLNTHEPFVLAAVGVQGSGKSHTLSCVLESCLLPFPEGGVVTLAQPQAALVLHYDQSPQSICEATGLVYPDPAVARAQRGRAGPGAPLPAALPRERLIILVSPTFYRQRRAFYSEAFTVRPLLLRWRSLTADHIKRIMRINDEDGSPLYVSTMLNLLRRFQRAGVMPSFGDFLACVRGECDVKGQGAPLNQRLKLLESIVADSEENVALAAEGGDIETACAAGVLVVVDLTDPLLAAAEANGIFHVCLEKFRALPLRCGKVLALDEAHKYMSSGDGLSTAIVNLARLVRHDGLRLAVSTQSPLALAPELLELVTVAVMHRFHSRDWHTYLAKKLALPEDAFGRITQLLPGEGLLFAARALDCGRDSDEAGGDAAGSDAVGGDAVGGDAVGGDAVGGDAAGKGLAGRDRAAGRGGAGVVRAAAVLNVQIRRRITADRGASRLNRATPAPVAIAASASS